RSQRRNGDRRSPARPRGSDRKEAPSGPGRGSRSRARAISRTASRGPALAILLELRHACEDQAEASQHDGSRARDRRRRAKEDRRTAEDRTIEDAHALRAERIRAHDSAAERVRRRQLDLRIRQRLREHRRCADDEQKQERERVVRREGEDEHGGHLHRRRANDEATAVRAVARVGEIHRGTDGADAAADQEKRIPKIADVEHIVSEQNYERVEGVAEEDHTEHLDDDERADERTRPHEAQAVAKRATDRNGLLSGERRYAYDREEDEQRDEGRRVDEESPARPEEHDDQTGDGGSDDLRQLPRGGAEADRRET